MANVIKLYVQRWTYERGNYQIIIENAWNLKLGYNQERVTVNGERILDRIPKLKVLLFGELFLRTQSWTVKAS